MTKKKTTKKKTTKPAVAVKRLPPDPNFEVKQLALNKGHDGSVTTKHGFYRKALTKEESEKAEILHAMFRERYGLDDLVDDMDLMFAVSNFVKALRPEPKGKESDKNVRSYQAFYARMFRDFIESLGLHRKQREENAQGSEVAEAIKSLFRPQGREVEMVQDPVSGTWRRRELSNEKGEQGDA